MNETTDATSPENKKENAQPTADEVRQLATLAARMRSLIMLLVPHPPQGCECERIFLDAVQSAPLIEKCMRAKGANGE